MPIDKEEDTMDCSLTNEQKRLKGLARQITEQYIFPARLDLDAQSAFPTNILQQIARAGLTQVFVPGEYGGSGASVLDACLVLEEIGRGCLGVSTIVGGFGLGALPIIIAGSEEQKNKYLPPIAKGELLPAFALTEPQAGSDAANIQTTATKDSDCFVLRGTKRFIVNAGEAKLYLVTASTNQPQKHRGLTAFLVDADTPGLVLGEKMLTMGLKATPIRELHFEDCRIPAANQLGQIGQGFNIAMQTVTRFRPETAAQALGNAQGALEEAVQYAKRRVQFGKPIIEQQAVAQKIAQMATQIEAARSLLYRAACQIDRGEESTKISAMTKLFTAQATWRTVDAALQIFGGNGYVEESFPIAKRFRDARITRIYEGTDEIQQLIIAKEIAKEH